MSQCYTVNFGAKCYSTNGLGLWLSPVSEKEKQNKNLFQEKVFFFSRKSVAHQSEQKLVPDICLTTKKISCVDLALHLFVLFLLVFISAFFISKINLRSRIGCCFSRRKQIASQMAELVEWEHHDLKVMGSISAKTQF